MAKNNHDQPQIIITNTDELASNTLPALVVLDIKKSDVLSLNICTSMNLLYLLIDNKENAMLYRNSLVFSVSGYDFDKRELAEIPEVRQYFQKLIKEWPHWVWFLAKGTGVIETLFSLVCEAKVTHIDDESCYIEILNGSEIQEHFLQFQLKSTPFYEMYNISISDMIEEMVEAMFELQGEAEE